ncbi:GLPGLI family protein [Spirosoma pomorum]
MIFLFALLLSSGFFQQEPTAYRVQYQLTYKPDSTNLKRIDSERFVLFIKPNEWSFYGSENALKSDSVSVLVKNGVIPETDLLDSRNRFRTRFRQYIHKEYGQKTSKLYETLGIQPFVITLPNELQWQLSAEQDSIAGFACTKATTTYAGRTYNAWFAPDIPISDGPYVFSGLPGLIVKLSDSRNHYVFTLDQFGPYTGKLTEAPTYRKREPVAISRQQAFTMREDMRKDPVGQIKRTSGIDLSSFQRDGSSATRSLDRSWDNNPLELK